MKVINKKIYLFSAVAIFLLVIIYLAISKPKVENKPISPTPFPTPIIYPTVNITTVQPSKSQSGADINATKNYFQNHPDLAIEADLRVSVPIQGNGFKINFSYQADKFQVYISQPYAANYANFQSWFSSKGLKNTSDFQIIYQ